MRTTLRTKKINNNILKEIRNHLDNNDGLTFNQALIQLGLTCIFEAEGDNYEYKFEVIDWDEDPEDQLNRIQINKHLYDTN